MSLVLIRSIQEAKPRRDEPYQGSKAKMTEVLKQALIFLCFFLDTDDTMYAETREMTKNDMTAFCKTKWDGHGHLAHFFSQIEYERLRFYVQYRVYTSAFTFLPIQQGYFRSYNYLLSDDKTKIFNYLPWHPGYPTEYSRHVYIYNNNKLIDQEYNDTPVICQSKETTS